MLLCNQYKNKQELAPRLGSICALCKQLDFRVVCSLYCLSVCSSLQRLGKKTRRMVLPWQLWGRLMESRGDKKLHSSEWIRRDLQGHEEVKKKKYSITTTCDPQGLDSEPRH